MLMLMMELSLCLQSVDEYGYNIFSFSQGPQFDLFLDFWPQFLHIQMSKRNFLMYMLFFPIYSKNLENQEVPCRPRDFHTEVTGFVFGFGFISCF